MLGRPTLHMSFPGAGREHVSISFGTKKAMIKSNQGGTQSHSYGGGDA